MEDNIISQEELVENLRQDDEYNKTLMFCYIFGTFGIHRFIHGKVGTGVLMFITVGGLGIWALVDLITIMTNNFTDINGKRIIRNQPFMKMWSNQIFIISLILSTIFIALYVIFFIAIMIPIFVSLGGV